MWLILMDNVWDGGCLEVYFVFVYGWWYCYIEVKVKVVFFFYSVWFLVFGRVFIGVFIKLYYFSWLVLK